MMKNINKGLNTVLSGCGAASITIGVLYLALDRAVPAKLLLLPPCLSIAVYVIDMAVNALLDPIDNAVKRFSGSLFWRRTLPSWLIGTVITAAAIWVILERFGLAVFSVQSFVYRIIPVAVPVMVILFLYRMLEAKKLEKQINEAIGKRNAQGNDRL